MKHSSIVHLGRAAILCALLARSSSAGAQSAEEPAETSAPTPPRLARSIEVRDPRRATTDSFPRASVELEIDVARDGSVRSVRVLRGAGDDLDAAAVSAARAFVFEPATRNGKPLAARIRYEYVFTASDVEESDATPDAESQDSETPAPGASPSPAPDASGGAPQATETEPTFEATARTDAPPREPTKRTLSREEMTRVAGTRGDPIRAVELLPGVSRPAPGGGTPILRGANSVDSQVFADGVPVPFLLHLGGLASFAHSRVLEAVDYYPSNFGVRYGRKVGGVIDVRFRDPRTDRLHGVLDLNLIDSSLVVETPVTETFSILAAARRSNIDAVLNSAQDNADVSIQAAPVYWDYQAVAAFKPTEADRLRLVAYGSSDRMAMLMKTPADDDPSIRGALDLTTVFHRVGLGWRHRWSGGSSQETEITYGRTIFNGAFGTLARAHLVTDSIQGRSEWTGIVSSRTRITGGVDLLGNYFEGTFSGLGPVAGEGDVPLSLATQKKIALQAAQWVWTPGAYIEAGIRPAERLLVTPGIRADYNDMIHRGSVDPRLSARLELTDTTALKGGVGRYSQAPLEQEIVRPIGNPNLGMTQALHTTLGVEQKLGESVTASVEGFAKWIDDIVTATPGGRDPGFINAEEGRIFGGEAFLRVKPTKGFFGFVSYTLSRSERRGLTSDWRLFDRDQPHAISAAAAYKIGRGWEVGASYRFTSGAPYTPIVASSYEATNDVYLPRLGASMSARNPPYSRLDLRVEKKWTFDPWSIAVYLDVQNVLNARNAEGFSYSYDYTRRQPVGGLPIIPSIGLRGEL